MTPTTRIPGPDQLHACDLDEIHDAVQRILHELDSQLPEAQARSGRNVGQSWLLFTYRTFQPPVASGIDPVVAGITLSRGSQGVLVRGDIAGELSGDVLLELPSHELVGTEAIKQAATEMARRLASETNRIREALADSGRRA